MPSHCSRQLTAPVLLAALALSISCASPAPPDSPPAKALRLPFQHGVRAVLHDSHGYLWFASHREGVARFDGERLTHLTTADGLSDSQVRRLHEAPDGTIWFECGEGLSFFDGHSLNTPTERDHAHRTDWQAAPGDLWFKSDASVGLTDAEGVAGVYRYDGRRLRWLAFPVEPRPDDRNYYSVTGVARGAHGRLWFATYGAVFGYDGAGFTVIDNDRLGLGGEKGFLHVRAILEDSRGRLWIGNNGIGVLVEQNGEFVDFTAQQGLGPDAEGRPGPLSRVFSIHEDRKGRLWFGTADQGAWRWDGARMEHFGPEQGLASAHVWSFHTDREGRLWAAGATPSGVYRLDGATFRRGVQ